MRLHRTRPEPRGSDLQSAPVAVRKLVAELLDDMSAPMLREEIEDALLFAGGFSRSERRRIAQALKRLPIIAVGSGQL